MPSSPPLIVWELLTVTASPLIAMPFMPTAEIVPVFAVMLMVPLLSDTAMPFVPIAEIVPELLTILMVPLLVTPRPFAPAAVMSWALFRVTRFVP